MDEPRFINTEAKTEAKTHIAATNEVTNDEVTNDEVTNDEVTNDEVTCPNLCSGHGDCEKETGDCLCESGFDGLDCGKQSILSLEKSSGVIQSRNPKDGSLLLTKEKEDSEGCESTCHAGRGTCTVLNANMQCVCHAGWTSGNIDGTTNLMACDYEICPKRCGMDDSTGISKGLCDGKTGE